MFGRFKSRPSPVVRLSPTKPCQPAFEQILDACLLDIQTHHKSLADCLRKYPSNADELRPLLSVAIEIQAVPGTSPSARFKQTVRQQFLEHPRGPVRQLARRAVVSSRRGRIEARLALALMAVLGLGLRGTVAASANALPGSPLYPVKRWTESIEVLLSSGSPDVVFRHAELARRRLDEIKALASYGEDELADHTVSDYEDEINFAVEGLRAGQQNRAPGTARVLREQLIGQLEELREFQSKVPAASVPVVKHAETAMTRAIDQLALASGN